MNQSPMPEHFEILGPLFSNCVRIFESRRETHSFYGFLGDPVNNFGCFNPNAVEQCWNKIACVAELCSQARFGNSLRPVDN